MKILINNDYAKIEDASKECIDLIDDELAVRQNGYFFSPSFKNGYWDGYIRFLDKKTNTFPTGLLSAVLKVVEDAEVIDERKLRDIQIPNSIDLIEPDAPGGKITLRDYQLEAVTNGLRASRGIVNVATNGGKTEIASGIIKTLLPYLANEERILFVTHNKEIFHQSAERISKRLGLPVGKVGDGVWDVKQVTVVMIPTVSRHIKKPKAKKDDKFYTKEMKSVKFLIDLLGSALKKDENNRETLINVVQLLEDESGKNRDQLAIDILTNIITTEKSDNGCLNAFKKLKKDLVEFEEKKLKKASQKHEEVIALLESAVCFIGDEAHHSSSSTWYDTLMLCKNAIYRFGLTGTVDKKDPINVMRLFGCMGDIVTKISNEYLIEKGFSAKPTIHLQEVSTPKLPRKITFQEAYEEGIVENVYRNMLIADKVKEKYEEGKGCLVIVNRKKHGENIQKLLEEREVECEFTHGSFSDREKVLDDMKSGKLKVLIATTILDEGVDVSGINCLWMAAGGKSFRQLLQRVGRGLRRKEDGSGLEVYDYLDYTQEYLTKHTQERYGYYKNENFEIKKV